jgi:hypothetical protein
MYIKGISPKRWPIPDWPQSQDLPLSHPHFLPCVRRTDHPADEERRELDPVAGFSWDAGTICGKDSPDPPWQSRTDRFLGPDRFGKSTTIYSILNEFDPLQHNIQTAESPIEVVIPHVNQVEISDFGRNTFLNWVRGIVREAPDFR